MRILGIDPGSKVAGYGIIDLQGTRMQYCASGCIRAKANTYFERVEEIYVGLKEIVNHYQPQTAVIEKVFIAKNPDSALKLGQVRGLALSALFENEVSIHEYAARAVKKSITGSGAAKKQQVQYMVQRLLSLTKEPPEDAADALALVICHIYHGAKE